MLPERRREPVDLGVFSSWTARVAVVFVAAAVVLVVAGLVEPDDAVTVAAFVALLVGAAVELRLRPAAAVLVTRNLARTTLGQWVAVMLIASSTTQIVDVTSGMRSRLFAGVLLVAWLVLFIVSLREASRWRRALADPTLADHVHPQ